MKCKFREGNVLAEFCHAQAPQGLGTKRVALKQQHCDVHQHTDGSALRLQECSVLHSHRFSFRALPP